MAKGSIIKLYKLPETNKNAATAATPEVKNTRDSGSNGNNGSIEATEQLVKEVFLNDPNPTTITNNSGEKL